MINIVRNFLDKYNIRNKSVIIAFSTGPDSCALARIINELREEHNLRVTLAYFNHMWRKEAIKEEEFTVEFSKKFNMNFIIKKAPSGIRHNEETAREYRYKFLYDCANDIGTDVVLLAHNKNDNVETLVYRVIKGTSVKGLCSIPENRDIFYRPLLKIEKREIYDYLDNINQIYSTDASNMDIKYKRNYIRSEILPLFEKINPNFMNNIDNLITTSYYASNQNSISDIMNEIVSGDSIIRSKYLSYGVEYRYEILNLYLGDKLKYRDFKTIKKLDDFISDNPHSKTSLNKVEFLRIRKDKIFIEKNVKGIKDEPTESFN